MWTMKKILWMAGLAAILCFSIGCASKLVKIDSSPAFAEIWINDDYIGKTPVYYEFSDKCHPWPIKKTEDYVIKANLPGHESEVKIFLDSPPMLDISYVPDEIFFSLRPAPVKDLIK
jgi:hypothetical protein